MPTSSSPHSAFASEDGELWIVEDSAGAVVGCCGWAPGAANRVLTVELRRLYVHPAARRFGLGRWLVERVVAIAHEIDAGAVELWSDTRFEAAHRLYARCGFEFTGERRELDDPSRSVEHRFLLALDATSTA